MLQPGTILNDVEGHDLGEGAVVVRDDNGNVKAVRIDNLEILEIDLGDAAYDARQAPEKEEIGPWGYDPDALDSPALHTIRNLPTYWGPRDPNSPSNLTDVSWRPEPYWRRMVHRYYSKQGKQTMSYRKRPQLRRGQPRRADPLPTMDPAPQVQPPTRQVQLDYGLPARMRLHQWEGEDDQALDDDTLVELTLEFWKQYRDKRTALTGHGSRDSLDLADWGLMFQRRMGLAEPEMRLLYRFMVGTALVPDGERRAYEDLLDTFQVTYFDQLT